MTDSAKVSISPLLIKLADPNQTSFDTVSAAEIATAISLIFTGSLSSEQIACLLYALRMTKLDRRPDVLAACASSMREAAARTDTEQLLHSLAQSKLQKGSYEGGLCDIVGTGGDGHNTYNVSTTASIISSALLKVAKHGNNASTSVSGSADFLSAANPAPVMAATNGETLPTIYQRSNYAFLYAREWHPGMAQSAPTRRHLPFRTIFNLLGPLANPVDSLLEARIVGVAERSLGPVFAGALSLARAPKCLVVCGAEDLDEISCAGETFCWLVHEDKISEFVLTPADFGLERFSLDEVAGGRTAKENALILERILSGQEVDEAILTFVLLNTAALLAVSGVCDAQEQDTIRETGPGGLRWKEGVRRARWCISSGGAHRQWDAYVKVTNEVPLS